MEKEKITLGIVFGGVSPEHEISCRSAASVLRHIDESKYNIVKIGITKYGQWFVTSADPDKIENGMWTKGLGAEPACIVPDRTVHGIRTVTKEIRLDCVFPVLHGEGGEDGSIQGLLELAGIPYVGPGVAASACSMDKGVTKAMVARTGIRQAKHCETNRYAFARDPIGELKKIAMIFHDEYPLFVKPAGTGSSIGVTKVNGDKELFEGIKIAAGECHKIIIEKEVKGRELEVAVLGNRNPQASPIGEIKSASDFYDYESKYINSSIQTSVVTDLPPTKEIEIQKAAVNIYRCLGCRGLSRVDFFLNEEDEVIFNEINTLPGFTSISMYPQLWAAAGLGFTELIDKLIDLAMEDVDEK